MTERWRPVVGYEGHYEVSNLGRVRRSCGGRGAQAGRILRRHDRSGDGYRSVQLCRKDRKRFFGVHALVAEAFLGRRPRGKFPNHKNLVKSDNRASNLEWLTRKQNAQHALRSGRKGGRSLPGADNGRAKLTMRQVAEIRRQKGRVSQRSLARLCGVSKTAIQLIHQGKHWR
jgi:hypothetical protein